MIADLDDQIVEALRLHARQRRHLRARLDLEHADGVGGAQHGVDLRIVGRQRARSRSSTPSWRWTSGTASSSTAIMPRPEQIDLDDAEVGAVVLVPLHDHPPRHARRLERHHLVEAAGGRSPSRPSAGRGGAAGSAAPWPPRPIRRLRSSVGGKPASRGGRLERPRRRPSASSAGAWRCDRAAPRRSPARAPASRTAMRGR